jgi:tRNA C32,U32 (ribose-2'-O)-methylase TrmJ
MIKISVTKIKTWLETLNYKWFTWIAAVSITVAVNLLVYNLTSAINKYKQNNSQQQITATKLVNSLDSINNEFKESLESIRKNEYLNYKSIQDELTSINLQLLVMNKKIEILSGHITGYEGVIRNEFSDLDKTLKQFVSLSRDSITIKYFRK